MTSALSSAMGYIRWQPFDTTTEEGRTKERYRRALLTTIANVASKLLALGVLLASIPLSLGYLGNERFGIWMTISSLAGLLAFLDFGWGSGLLNLVATAAADPAKVRLRSVVTNGLLILCAGGLVVGTLLMIASRHVPWPLLIKLNDPTLVPEIELAARNFALIFGMSLPLLGIQRTFLGLQEGFLVHTATACTSIISLILLVVATSQEAPIPDLILVTFGVQTAAPVLLLPLLVRRKLVGSTSFRQFRDDARVLIKTGNGFFVLQLGSMVAWGSDSLIVSSLLGASQVATLAVTSRLFQLVTQPVAMLTNPLWSGYADAITRGDILFVKNTLKRSMWTSAALSFIGVTCILLAYEWLVARWSSNRIELPFLVVACCAVWTILETTGNAFAMFLNGLGILRPQVSVVAMFCLVAIPLKIYLVSRVGLYGIFVGTIISYLVAVVLPYLTFLKPTWATRL